MMARQEKLFKHPCHTCVIAGLTNDVPDIWDAAKVAFEGGGVLGG